MTLSYEQINKLVDKEIDSARSANFIAEATKNIQCGITDIKEKLDDYAKRHNIINAVDDFRDHDDYYLVEGRFNNVVKELNRLLFEVNYFLQSEQVDNNIKELKTILTGKKES